MILWQPTVDTDGQHLALDDNPVCTFIWMIMFANDNVFFDTVVEILFDSRW